MTENTMNVKRDIDSVLADSAGSFIIIKESIKNILEQLKLQDMNISSESVSNIHQCQSLTNRSSITSDLGASILNESNSGKYSEVKVVDFKNCSSADANNYYGYKFDEKCLNAENSDTSDDSFIGHEEFPIQQSYFYGGKILTNNKCLPNRLLSTSDTSDATSSDEEMKPDGSKHREIGFESKEKLKISDKLCSSKKCQYFVNQSCKCAAKSGINGSVSVKNSPFRKRYKARNVFTGNGHLKLAIYINSGLMTVHIQKCRKLKCKLTDTASSFVKIKVIPKHPEGLAFRTQRMRTTNNPKFDQKFSFELSPMIIKKRLYISVWHRNNFERCNEKLGCMSFGLNKLVNKTIEGWYFLLTDTVGKQKHFAVTK